MSGSDRSWTIAPALLSFCGFLIAALLVIDGDLDALADRLVQQRETPPASATTPFQPAPVTVAEAEPPEKSEKSEKPAALPADKGDRSRVGALEDVCIDGTPAACKRWGLDGYYRALSQSKQGKLGRALRVSWYGDSVVAGDSLPARLRSRLQQELGDGGPGYVFIVPPHRFCLHESITRSRTDGEWLNYAVSTVTHQDGLYGAGGAFSETYGGNTTIKLVSGKVTQVELYYLGQKGGGTIKVLADGTEVIRAETKADKKTPAYATAAVPGGASKFQLELAKGRSRVFGLTLENGSGAVVDNFGIVSASVINFGQRDAAHWASELAHRGADLIMIMLGANEATWLGPNDADTKQYQARYEKMLEPVRQGRPDASCLVISPSDAAETKDGSFRSRPVIPVLVEAQRKAAQAKGCAFFATYEWMGGKGSAVKWNRSGLIGGDFVHLSVKGAQKLSDALYDALTTGSSRYGGP
ncbi:MAG TPA: GDSL-type esterase/lipase family protein [Kofleriaceae bacterium]|nr:GDSL-type esterase/lipase family protein [Kofleriaceae bacterium]